MLFAARFSPLAIAALVLAGCGGRAKPASAPTATDYEWSSFNGGKEAPSSTAKQEKGSETKGPETKGPEEQKPEKEDAKTVAGDDAGKPVAPATEAPKRVSATKVGGQSVSEVSADAVATAMQRATKRNLVSTNVIVGAQYEQVSVVLEKLAVQIVRPAAAPDQTGPKVRSPKARKEGVADTNSAFYDPNADVLVLVQADKKATSARALAALISAHGAPAAPAKKVVRAKQRRGSKGA